ncbi:MAG: DEAD/DEAH box helicase, partial [Acidobacteriota bacterium]
PAGDDAEASSERSSGRRRTSRRRAGAAATDDDGGDDDPDDGPDDDGSGGGTAGGGGRRSRRGRRGRDDGEGGDVDVGEEDQVATGLATGAIDQGHVSTTDLSFADLDLSAPVLEAVESVGFVHPTPIQAGVMPHALAGKDVIGLAETGSGKTAAFVLPMAEHLHDGTGMRGLIVCPTREIALQTKAFLDLVGRDHLLDAACIIGGVRFGPQIDHLGRPPDIIVATPGRLVDHYERGNVRFDAVRMLVLDEADHMLDLGFLPQIQSILERLPPNRQTLMFSATMPPAIARLTQRFMDTPETIDLRPAGHTASGLDHRVYLVNDGDQLPCLHRLLETIDGSTLIFTRRRLDSEWLSRQLDRHGHAAARIHSDLTQAQRVAALRSFREGRSRVLVATDVAARGIDIPRIGHVINFGFPDTVEDYVHRSGRTARGDNEGIVSSIGTWQNKAMINEIEAVIGQSLTRHTVDGVEAYVELTPRRRTVRRRRLL